MVGSTRAAAFDIAAEEYAATLVVAASSQDKLLKVADRYRRPFAAMILEPMITVRESLSEETLEMLFSLGEQQAVLAYLERMIAGLEAPFRIAAKSKASTMILDINAAAGNATRCEFGGATATKEQLTKAYHDSVDALSKGQMARPYPSDAVMDKLYDDVEAAQKALDNFGKNAAELFAKNVTATKAQRVALNDYAIGSGYEQINTGLRSGKLSAPLTKSVKTIDSLMQPLKGEQTLYRLIDKEFSQTFKAGQKFADKAFLSTTRQADNFEGVIEGLKVGDDYSVVHLTVPKGVGAIDVGATLTDVFGEQEVLLARGQKMKVVKIVSRGGRRHIYMQVIK